MTDPYEKLNGELPPECVDLYKGFLACKVQYDEELFKDKDLDFKENYQYQPFSRIEGCKTMWNSFYKCKEDFINKYIDLKNYVAELNGHPPAINKLDRKIQLEANYTRFNFGLNKF